MRDGVKVNNIEICEIRRLGERTEDVDHKRPILVQLSTEEEKWDILKKAKNLRNSDGWMKKIGISLDLSKEERMREKDLVNELKEKRRKGEEGWFIYKGKLQCRTMQ